MPVDWPAVQRPKPLRPTAPPRRWLAWLLLCLCPGLAQAVQLRLCQTEAPRYEYRLAVTRLVLQKTVAADEPVELQRHGAGADPAQDRCLELLRQGEVDLVYLPPNEQRMAEFGVLPVDLYRGLLGYRLLLIRRQDEPRFASTDTLAQLRRFTGGFGRQWADLLVFERNGLPVMTGPGNEALIAMLKARRFDYLHRGITEAFAELAQFDRDAQLMVEPHLALHYDFPVYFMVRRERTALLAQLRQGLQKAQADGSFQRLFEQHFAPVLQRAHLGQRRLIELDYPLPAGLPRPERLSR